MDKKYKGRITQQNIDDVQALRRQGLSLRAACMQLGLSRCGVRYALNKLGIKAPHSKGLSLDERIKPFLDDIRAKRITQVEVAKRIGSPTSALTKVYKRLGLPTLKRGEQINPKSSKLYDKEKTDEYCEKVIDYLQTHGGYLQTALKKVGLPTYFRPTFLAYAKKVGFDHTIWKQANQRYGYWLTLPCVVEKCYTCDYRVQAMCTKCGTVHTVQMTNLRSGASTQCRDCATIERANKEFPHVQCVETGEVFRSYRHLCKILDLPYNASRRRFVRNGHMEHNGMNYKMIDKSEVNAQVN